MNNIKTNLLRCAVTAALGGFLFGFDTVVISGAEQQIQELWGLSSGMHGLAMSMALWGTVIGALFGGWPTDRFGRQRTLLYIGILYFVSAVGSALAPEFYTFAISRFIGGVGIGISTVASPLYISEISPAEKRGRLTCMFQFNIVFGILIAFLSNYILGTLISEDAWRWMMGVEAIPALFYSAMCFFIPESPRWLISQKEDVASGKAILQAFHRCSNEEANQKVEEIQEAAHSGRSEGRFFSKRLTVPILLAFLIAFFNQLSGINAILYFAPRIFAMTGLEDNAALLQSVGIGITNLIFTFIGLWLIDRLGRRTLLFIGSFGYIASLGLCSYAFFSESFTIVPACIFAFIAAHAIGQGAVIWVFISEIFPNKHRAHGQALGSFTHWFFAAALTLVFPLMVEHMSGGFIFLVFTGMMVLQLVWVKLMVPETKGRSLEEIERHLNLSKEELASLKASTAEA